MSRIDHHEITMASLPHLIFKNRDLNYAVSS